MIRARDGPVLDGGASLGEARRARRLGGDGRAHRSHHAGRYEVAAAEVGIGVGTGASVEMIAAGPADQSVVSGTGDERVVAAAAVQILIAAGGGDGIVAR